MTPRATRRPARGQRASHADLDGLFGGAASLFRRFRRAVEDLHGDLGVTGGKRGILRELHRGGPRTVPEMARGRSVSRQHVQVIVNALLEGGAVELVRNPEHRRSKRVRLTRDGDALVAEMARRERAFTRQLEHDLTSPEVRLAADVLARARTAFERDPGV